MLKKYNEFKILKLADIFEQHLLAAAIIQGEGDWASLSLMQRVRAGAHSLLSFPQASTADIFVDIFQDQEDLSGWLSLIACEYVATHLQFI